MHLLARRCCSHPGIRALHLSRIVAPRWAEHSSSLDTHRPLSPFLVRRNYIQASKFPRWAEAIVIGGGPAGIAAVGTLLDHIPEGTIVWIDRSSFKGGSIGQLYREVPSYSPAGDYLRYARTPKSFRDIVNAAPKPNAITALEELQPDMTCSLSYAADMLELITNGLLKHDRVEPVVGNVTNLGRNPGTRRWYVTLEPNEIGHDQSVLKYQTPMVVYCTGSHPITTELPLDIPRLSLETGLAPSRLAKLLPTDKPCTVAVIGDGHSAVLTLRNLFYLAAISHRHLRIRWFTRTANLRYAEETPEGVILNENTGLMGEAARFARAQLEGDKLETSDAGAFITRVILPTSAGNDESATRSPEELESEVLAQNLEGVDYVIQAIGFTRSRLPALVPRLSPYRDPLGKPKRMVFNALTGWFFPNFASRSNVIGLFGAGSAFPELEFTSEGWRSPAVSIWKFMRFLQRMVPKWIEATKKGKFAEPPNRQECIEEAPRVVPPERLECIEEAPRLHGGGSS